MTNIESALVLVEMSLVSLTAQAQREGMPATLTISLFKANGKQRLSCLILTLRMADHFVTILSLY